METTRNYFLVGLFVLIVVAAGIFFSLWLTSVGKGETMRYQIYFTESVAGLKAGSLVKFRGVDVGAVENMAIDPRDSKRIRVEIKILKSTPVKTGTVASLEIQGVSGNAYLELSGGKPDEPNLAEASKEEIPEIREGPSHSMNAVFKKLDHVAGQLEKVFSDRNVRAVNGAIGNLSKALGGPGIEEPSSPRTSH